MLTKYKGVFMDDKDMIIHDRFEFRGGSFQLISDNENKWAIADYGASCMGLDPIIACFFDSEDECHEWLNENVPSTYTPMTNC